MVNSLCIISSELLFHLFLVQRSCTLNFIIRIDALKLDNRNLNSRRPRKLSYILKKFFPWDEFRLVQSMIAYCCAFQVSSCVFYPFSVWRMTVTAYCGLLFVLLIGALILLYSEWPELSVVLAIRSSVGLNKSNRFIIQF